MPPKKKSKYLGEFSKNSKVLHGMEKKIQDQLSVISEKEQSYEHLKDIESSLDLCSILKSRQEEINRKIEKERQKLHYKQRRLKNLRDENSTNNNPPPAETAKRMQTVFSISTLKRNNRKRKPTTEHTPHMAKVVRRSETLQACNAIHGGSVGNINPTVTGIIDTLSSKCKSKLLADIILKGKQSVVNNIEKKVIGGWSSTFYKSLDNTLRSLNVFYSHNMMGKQKYLSVRKANKNKDIPNFIPYAKLADYINSIEIGKVNDVIEDFGTDLDESDKGPGKYRPFDVYALRMVDFYLKVDSDRSDKLMDFPNFKKKDTHSKLFVVSIGGDGAPGSGTVFLASFLNVAKRVASSSENFLIFGANVAENSKLVRRYVLKLFNDIKYLESNVFTTSVIGDEVKIEFCLGELPNDLKMLCFLAGELTNAAHYFSTFANVNKENCKDFSKNIASEKNDWKVFHYQKRINDVKKVSAKKKELEKSKSSLQTKRSNLTSYISSLKSRQEFVPLVSTYIDRAKAEPLHLKNNVVKEMFLKLLRVAADQSRNRCKSYKDLQETDFLHKFIEYIRTTMSCNYLASKLVQWYNESGGKLEGEFSFRFRGKESYIYLQKFPFLIKMMLQNLESNNVQQRIYEVFYQSVHLRKIISYSVRIVQFNKEILKDLSEECYSLYKACCILDRTISPSLWTLCKAVPVHATQTFNEYGLGLGVNTMEGREQKHQIIKRYAEKTTFQNRWGRIFRHEFIQLIYLRENGYDTKIYRKCDTKYVPEHSHTDCEKCCLPLENMKCVICDSTSMNRIQLELRNK